MRAGIHVANFTWQGGPAEMGPRLAELAVVSEEIGCPELLIGGRGERKTLRLVARYAGACNLTSDTAEEIRHKFAVLRGHCETEGADYDAIEKTVAWTGSSLDSEDARAFPRPHGGVRRRGRDHGHDHALQRRSRGGDEALGAPHPASRRPVAGSRARAAAAVCGARYHRTVARRRERARLI